MTTISVSTRGRDLVLATTTMELGEEQRIVISYLLPKQDCSMTEVQSQLFALARQTFDDIESHGGKA